jgi:hypothetical protein
MSTQDPALIGFLNAVYREAVAGVLIPFRIVRWSDYMGYNIDFNEYFMDLR